VAVPLLGAGAPVGSAGAYQNFPDPDLRDRARAYYGANLQRLRRVKARYDPGNCFPFPQSLPGRRAAGATGRGVTRGLLGLE
jgi:hypothetical protein